MATPYNYTPQTYSKDGLIYQNGKIYYQPTSEAMGQKVRVGSPVEVRPWDLIKYNMESPLTPYGSGIPVRRYAGAFSDLSGMFLPPEDDGDPWTVERGISGTNPYASALNLTPEQKFSWFTSDPFRRSTLYGAYADVGQGYAGSDLNLLQGGLVSDDTAAPNPYEYMGQEYTPYRSEVGGHAGFTKSNADYVMNTLQQFFPNATPEQMDAAAYAAMADTSNQRWREGRAGQAWYYAGNPNDYVRQIAAKMGGLQPQQEALLAATDTKMAQQGASYRSAAHAADDAATQKRFMDGLKSAGMLVGGAFGLSSLLNTGLSGLLGSGSGIGDLMAGLGDTTADIIAGNAAAGAGAGGNAMSGLFSGLGDTTADLIANATSDGLFSTTDFANLFKDFVVDDKIQVLTNMGVPESIATQVAPNLSGTALQNLIDLSTSGVSGLNTLKSVLGSTSAGGVDWAKLASGGLSALGGMLSGSSAQDAQSDYAKSLKDIAKMNQFRPVGVTTRFGSSQFTTDPTTGQVATAGYNLSPDVKAIQDRQMGMLPGLQSQYENVSKLGAGYLKATPEQQAADWMAKQQNILSASRATDLANLRNKMVQEGRSGLGIGGDAGMMAANPELAAYYNSIQQQNRELAGQADQFGKQNALFGLDLQSQAYKPLQTALGGASYLEGLGQQPMDLGINIGAKGQAANQPSMELLAKSAQAQMPANAYNPWGAALQGAGGMLQNYTQQQQQQQALTDMFGNLFSKWGT